MDAESDRDGIAMALLAGRRGRRDFVPISREFLQTRRVGGGAGPLSRFVKARRKRALDLYLLCHALAISEPYDIAMPARIWALALGMPDTQSSRVFISESFTWLEKNQLVRTKRDGRLRRIWLLDESGSGRPYEHGGKMQRRKLDYFKLPYAFWLESWHMRLDLSATAVLLIALSLPSSFSLPQQRGGEWYGISRDTIRRGVRTLRRSDLLSMRTLVKQAPLSPTGLTEQRNYTLVGPFAREHRLPGRRPS